MHRSYPAVVSPPDVQEAALTTARTIREHLEDVQVRELEARIIAEVAQASVGISDATLVSRVNHYKKSVLSDSLIWAVLDHLVTDGRIVGVAGEQVVASVATVTYYLSPSVLDRVIAALTAESAPPAATVPPVPALPLRPSVIPDFSFAPTTDH